MEALVAQVLTGEPVEDGQDRLHLLNLCGLALANAGSSQEAARVLDEATRLGVDLLTKFGKRISTHIEATRAFEQQAEFLRQAGDVAAAARLLQQARQVWLATQPETTYVRIRRARADRLLAELRKARGVGLGRTS